MTGSSLPAPQTGGSAGRSPRGPLGGALGLFQDFGVLLGAATGLVAAFFALRDKLKEGLTDFQATDWFLAVAVLLVFLLVVAFDAWPKWRKRVRENRLRNWGADVRPGYFRMTPYEKEDTSAYRRADGAHEAVLRLVSGWKEPLLVLTGTSGSGKSSLLNAFVIPELERGTPPARCVVVRSFGDPVGELRTRLTEPGTVWNQPPRGLKDLGDGELFDAATKYLEGERLLVVFDQFEELFVLHGEASDQGARTRELFEAAVSGVRRNVTLLVALRDEYLGLLSGVGTPPLREGENYAYVGPFSLRQAEAFLEAGVHSRGEAPAQGTELISSILREANAIEGTTGLVRPITLNMLGVLMGRLSERVGHRRAPGRMLTEGLHEILFRTDLRETAPPVLRRLLTEEATKAPRSAADLTDATRLGFPLVEGCLLRLRSEGLVRYLNKPADPRNRIWEISHDFVALLVDRVLKEARTNPWPVVRRATLVFAFVLLGVAGGFWWASRPVPPPDLMPFYLAVVGDAGAPLTERIKATEDLGRLGDPRLSEADRWIRIPGGPFIMGQNFREEDEEKEVDVQTFEIQRWLTTIGEFGRYLEESPDASRPEFWYEQVLRKSPNHPVTGVDFEQATAYCKWLGARLPTEEEWEKSARGGLHLDGTDENPLPRRMFPWGDEEPDESRANVGTTDIGGTTPVGVFLNGHGPYGTWDQAGNVWEWCSSPWDPDDHEDEGVWYRPVRGGGNFGPPIDALLGVRAGRHPAIRYMDVGFRPARSVTP